MTSVSFRVFRVFVSVLAVGLLAAPATLGQEAVHQTVVLDNGLTLLLTPNDAHPVVALSMFVTTGGRTEDEYYQGSLHYIEHLIFKGGTPNLAPTEFRKRMSTLGRESGGWTWDDEINFGFEVPKESFAEALGVFREAMLDLEFEEQWFEDEKRVVLQEMEKGRERPANMMWEAWDAMAFPQHPYGRSVIGTEKAINELEMQRTEQYYRDRFSPNHIVLSIVGSFEVEAMVETIAKIWGSQPRGPESFELGFEEPEQRGPRWREDYVPQASTARMVLGVVGPVGSDADTMPLTLLAALLSDSNVGFRQYLVEQEKWVAWVGANHYPMRDASTFQVTAEMEAEKLPAVRRFVQQFLLDFDATEVPESVFEEVRRALLAAEARERGTFAEAAERTGFLFSRLGDEGARQYRQRLESVTAEEVQQAKERWISARRLITATVLPEDFTAPETVVAVSPRPPQLATAPDLEVPGALRPAPGDPLGFELVKEEDGTALFAYDNGLRLVVRDSSASQLLAVSGRVLGGQWVEPAGQEGINRMVAELGMRRTRRWNSEGLSRLEGALSISTSAHAPIGGRTNSSRNVDYRDAAGHHVQGLASGWKESLAILKETLFFPEFATEEVEKVRQDLLNEISTLPENNLEYIKQEFYLRTFAGHPYGRPTVGTQASISALTPEQLSAFHAAHWTPDRLVVSVVGDVRPPEVANWIARHWNDVPARRAGAVEPRGVEQWTPPADRQVLDLGKDQWTVNWGRPGAAAADPELPVSRLLARIVGSDHFYKYVYEEGVSYRSWINFWSHLGPGAWILENDVQRERFDQILDLFEEDLARYRAGGFSEEEYDRAKSGLLNRFYLGAQDNGAVAWNLAVHEGNGVGFANYLATPEQTRAVSLEEVKALAVEVFDPAKILRLQQQ